MLIHVSRRMEESKDLLSEADRAIGDGDHGIGMARGFEAVRRKLEGGAFTSAGELGKSTGMALLTSVGGASGAIFGTLFQGGASELEDQQSFTSDTLSRLLLSGLAAVTARGKAKVGDKTMVDALEPAALRSIETRRAFLGEALASVTEAARLGMEKTKEMRAALGKARTLGERSLGHVDPGAVSMYLILKFMTEYVTQLEREEDTV